MESQRLLAFGDLDERPKSSHLGDYRVNNSQQASQPDLHQACCFRKAKYISKAKCHRLTDLTLLTKTKKGSADSGNDSSNQSKDVSLQASPIRIQGLPVRKPVKRTTCRYVSVALKEDTARYTTSAGDNKWSIDVTLRPEPELAKTRDNMYHTSRDEMLHLRLKVERFLPSKSSRCQSASPQMEYYQDLLNPSSDRKMIEDTRSEMTRLFQSKHCNVCKMPKNHDGIPVYSHNLLTARDHPAYRPCVHKKANTYSQTLTNPKSQPVLRYYNPHHSNSASSLPSTPKSFRVSSTPSYRNYPGLTNDGKRPTTIENSGETSDVYYSDHSTSLVNLTKSPRSYSRNWKSKRLQKGQNNLLSGSEKSVKEGNSAGNPPATWPNAQDIKRLACNPDTDGYYLDYQKECGNKQENKPKNRFSTSGYYVKDSVSVKNKGALHGNFEDDTSSQYVEHKVQVKAKKPDIIVPCHTLGECELCTSHWESKGLQCTHEQSKANRARDKDVVKSNSGPYQGDAKEEDPVTTLDTNKAYNSNVQSDVGLQQQIPDDTGCTNVKPEPSKPGKTIQDIYQDYSEEPYVFQKRTKESVPLRYLHGKPRGHIPDLTTKLLFRLSYMKVSE